MKATIFMLEKIILFITKRQLIWQQKKNIISLTILENYLTNAVLEGERIKQNQLVDVQNKVNESQKFLKYLQSR